MVVKMEIDVKMVVKMEMKIDVKMVVKMEIKIDDVIVFFSPRARAREREREMHFVSFNYPLALAPPGAGARGRAPSLFPVSSYISERQLSFLACFSKPRPGKTQDVETISAAVFEKDLPIRIGTMS
jgi:hypothetical protein